MTDRIKIVLSLWTKGEAPNCKCSLCGQVFILRKDRGPKEAMAEVLAAFHEHVHEEH